MHRPIRHRGRSALGNRPSRYSATEIEAIDDGWEPGDATVPTLRTRITPENCRRILSFNRSPDVPFDRSINPYRGCEHGCIYCFARPSHAYMDLSPGLDFESRLFFKAGAADRLRTELGKSGYQPRVIALGVNTDCYQPLERQQGITRQLLEVMLETRHPVSIITKSALIERDLDLIAELAALELISVAISLTSLDRTLSRTMEPRAASPQRRLQTIRRLVDAAIPVTALLAPVIPVLNDAEMENLLEQAQAAGAGSAGYILLRLPQEVAPLFAQWLNNHYPDKAEHVMARVRDCRNGRDYDSRFGHRMRGTGLFAELIEQRFELACRRLTLKPRWQPLRVDLFRQPTLNPDQMSLF